MRMAPSLWLSRWAASLLPCAMACAVAFGQAARAGSTLQPGPELADCRSALRSGPNRCGEDEARSEGRAQLAASAASLAAQGEGALDARVEDFLANFGKPPRSAVRALLQPTDDNIRAYLREQQETLAITAYVAQRMTEMQHAGDDAPADEPSRLGLLPGAASLRATLTLRPGAPGADEAIEVLSDFARRLPDVSARVRLVGPFAGGELRTGIGRIGQGLAISVVDAPDDSEPIPNLRLERPADGRSVVLEAAALDPLQILTAADALLAGASQAAGRNQPARSQR